MYWLRYVCEKMSIQSHQDYQRSQKYGQTVHTQIWKERFQIAQIAHPKTRPDFRFGGYKRYWKINSVADPREQAKAKPGQFYKSPRLEGHPKIFQRLLTPKFLHEDVGG